MRFLMSILLTILSLTSFSQEGVQVEKPQGTVAGVTYGFLQYTPPAYATLTTVKYPLVIFLHGNGQRGNGTTDLPKVTKHGPPKLIAAGQDFNAVILSPQLPLTGGWYAPAIDELIQYALTNHRIETGRVYITGLSIGGGGTWDFAQFNQVMRDRVAAIWPISCTTAPMNASLVQGLPIWAFHNSGDPNVPLSMSADQINAAVGPGSNVLLNRPNVDATAGWNGLAWTWSPGVASQSAIPLFTVYTNTVHDAWTVTYSNQNVWNWLYDQHRFRAVVDIVMDEQDVGTSYESTPANNWAVSNSAPGGHKDGVYFYLYPNAQGSFIFTPTIVNGSRYEVSVWHPISMNRGIVQHDVYYNDGRSVSTVQVDQRVNGGNWTVLGTYWINSGAGKVVIRSSGVPYGVVADAVRFREVNLPVVLSHPN